MKKVVVQWTCSMEPGDEDGWEAHDHAETSPRAKLPKGWTRGPHGEHLCPRCSDLLDPTRVERRKARWAAARRRREREEKDRAVLGSVHIFGADESVTRCGRPVRGLHVLPLLTDRMSGSWCVACAVGLAEARAAARGLDNDIARARAKR